MNHYILLLTRIIFSFLILFSVSCGKNIYYYGDEEEMINMNFKFLGFTSQLSPFNDGQYNYNKLSTSSLTNDQNEVFLYYWSFNNDNLLADILYDTDLSPSISYINGDLPTTFVNSTYTFNDFIGGRAVTFSGAKEILIKLPIRNVKTVSSLGFDVGSPSTGPKDFDIHYSINKGATYEILSLDNQFENTNTANHKHTYKFDLTLKSIKGEELWIKILPKAGERGTSGNFNENSGTLRMDNLYLRGIVSNSSTPGQTVDKLHFFLFNKDRSKPVISGVRVLDEGNALNLSIPAGEYDICFISNDTQSELLLPQNYSMDSFYAGNVFSNLKANIFGYVGNLIVKKEMSSQITLERLYGQVSVRFLDTKGLENITKIVVKPLHESFIYDPFNLGLSNPILDHSTIEIVDDFSVSKEIVFNQFLGKQLTPKLVSYRLDIYGEEGLIRTLEISSNLKSNMKLQFTGEILKEDNHASLFSILKNEDWESEESVKF